MLITNIGRLVTMDAGPGREGPLGVIPNAAIVLEGERIAWLGAMVDLPAYADTLRCTAMHVDGLVVMPGLVDCHTHLVHGGDRIGEFVQRARGVTYQEIARAGGGIRSTVSATRAADEQALVCTAYARAFEALRLGSTTLEIKSGYGLSLSEELKMLRVIRQLAKDLPQTVVATFLGAHVVPDEYTDHRAGYVQLLIEEMLPAIAQEGLAEFCDVFVDDEAFTADEARAICRAGKELGLTPRLHVDQFADGGGGALAAELGAASADHLDHLSAAGIQAMASQGTIAGILPGASFFVRAGAPPVADLVKAGVPMAIASDYNPGSSPSLNLFLCGTIAVTQYGLDPDLALLGMTRIPARVLQREDQLGSLAVGKRADLLIVNAKNEYAPLYNFGSTMVRTVIAKGEVVWDLN